MTEPTPQPTVTRGTAIGATVGGFAGGALATELGGAIWHLITTGTLPTELSATVLTFIGSLVVGAVGIVIALVTLASTVLRWWLRKKGVLLGENPMFDTKRDDK